MTTLYLTEQNSVLRKTGNRLIVQKQNETLFDIQCHKIDAVLIFGNVQVTTQAVTTLLENGIEMAILSRTGRLKGQITSPATKNIALRLEQFRKYHDDAFRLSLSKQIVIGKLVNSLNFIRRFSYNHPETDSGFEAQAIETAIKTAESAENIGQLMGIEGSAAKNYFGAFGKMILGSLGFPGRRKRPPTDPVNAMLSLSYTMIFNEISSLLDGLGFDPYLGYFHSVDYGRASLASDLMEEFRAPIADRLILNLVNKRVFAEKDFFINMQNKGVYFQPESLKRYFKEYEKHINRQFVHPETKEQTTLRKCFRIQAEKMASTIQNNTPYVPFFSELM